MTGTRPPRSSPLAASRSRGPDRFSPLPSTIDPVSWDTTAEDCPRRVSRSLRSTSPTGTAARPSSSLRSTTSRPRQERSQQQEEGGAPKGDPSPGHEVARQCSWFDQRRTLRSQNKEPGPRSRSARPCGSIRGSEQRTRRSGYPPLGGRPGVGGDGRPAAHTGGRSRLHRGLRLGSGSGLRDPLRDGRRSESRPRTDPASRRSTEGCGSRDRLALRAGRRGRKLGAHPPSPLSLRKRLREALASPRSEGRNLWLPGFPHRDRAGARHLHRAIGGLRVPDRDDSAIGEVGPTRDRGSHLVRRESGWRLQDESKNRPRGADQRHGVGVPGFPALDKRTDVAFPRMQAAQSSVPRSVSSSTKTLLVAGAVVGTLIFLLIVEFGFSAGRVHPGVTVGGHDVGGLTFTELQDELARRAEILNNEPVCFVRDVLRFCISPTDVEWRPEARATADLAYQVGRADSLWGALGERTRAWVGGVNVQWEGGPNAARVGRWLDRWERILAARDLELKRGIMRYRIRRAIITYPRQTFRIPVQ